MNDDFIWTQPMNKLRLLPNFLTLLSLCALAGVLPSGPAVAADQPSGIPDGYSLQYEQRFDSPAALKELTLSDSKAWRFAKDGDSGALELHGKSDYQPKDRSPFNIALVANRQFTDFVLEAELQSTVKPYPHQDMCLFFGYEATNRFYYAHIAVKPDPIKAESHAHDIFIVNDKPRLAIAKEVSAGVTWGENQWHKVRVERRIADGTIKVFFDDMTKPIMHGVDKTFASGCVGFGSFDDKGKVRNVKIWAPSTTRRKTDFFPKPE
jgi:hypothetical protein